MRQTTTSVCQRSLSA